MTIERGGTMVIDTESTSFQIKPFQKKLSTEVIRYEILGGKKYADFNSI